MDERSVCIPGLVSANEAVVLERLVPSRGAADGDEPALAGMAFALRLPHRLLLSTCGLHSPVLYTYDIHEKKMDTRASLLVLPRMLASAI